jgi:hypothetical protein
VRFAGRTASAYLPDAADLAARDAARPRAGSPSRPWPRCDEPEDEIDLRGSAINA